QMLEHLERADRVVAAGMRGKMRAQRLVAHLRDLAFTGEMRIKPGIARLRNDAAELGKAAADIEHARARRNVACRQMKFLPEAVARPQPALDRIGVELVTEGVVTLDQGIEEVQAGRRFPQSKALNRAEARTRIDAHAIAPQIDQEARPDPLHKPRRGLASHRAEWIWHRTCVTSAHEVAQGRLRPMVGTQASGGQRKSSRQPATLQENQKW